MAIVTPSRKYSQKAVASMVHNPNLNPNPNDCTTLFTITTKKYTLTHTHTHNRFTAGLEYVRVHPGQQVPER